MTGKPKPKGRGPGKKTLNKNKADTGIGLGVVTEPGTAPNTGTESQQAIIAGTSKKNPYGTKLERITGETYVKPVVEAMYTLSELEELLEDHVEEPVENIPVGSIAKYLSKVNGVNKFRKGGTIINNKGLPNYVVMASGGKSWCVQVQNTRFFRQLRISEIRAEYEALMEEDEDKYDMLKMNYDKLLDSYNDRTNDYKALKEEYDRMKGNGTGYDMLKMKYDKIVSEYNALTETHAKTVNELKICKDYIKKHLKV